MDDIQNLLARNIKEARTKLGYSQLKLAEITDLSPVHVNDLEQGRKWVSAKTLDRLARALAMEPYQLLIDKEVSDKLEKFDLLTELLKDLKGKINRNLEETIKHYISKV